MQSIKRNAVLYSAVFILEFSIASFGNPNLMPGVWTNIGTPSTFNLSGTFGTPFIEIDPSRPDTLYVCADQRGLWRSYNAGETWTRVGTPPSGSCDYKDTVHYLDSPIRVEIDPNNPLHMYATQGVRGCTQGFWITKDGGATWIRSKAYRDACQLAKAEAMDNTGMDIDPTDFNHILISFHYYWNGGASGIFESKDGGVSWIVHNPPQGMCCASKGVHFLYCPEQGIGNANTWLVSDDATDYWRTTDAGQSWTMVSAEDPPHGGIANVYYAKNGVVYAGNTGSLLRSTNNGATWTRLSNTGLGGWVYGTTGDGNLLYAHSATTGDYAGTYLVSKETDGLNWAPYKVGAQAQSVPAGPFNMAFDKINRIMYSANWTQGIWALKVDTGTTSVTGLSNNLSQQQSCIAHSRIFTVSGEKIFIMGDRSAAVKLFDLYDVKGNLIDRIPANSSGVIAVDKSKISCQAVIVRAR